MSKPVNTYALLGILAVFGWMALLGDARAAGRLSDYLGKAEPAELVAEANRFGPPQGDPAIVPAYKDDRLLGFVYLNSDFANATGYSGKPIQLLVGIDPKGVLTGIKLVEHKEPIVLVGIPEKRVLEAVNTLIGDDMDGVARGAERPPAGRHRQRRDRHGAGDGRQRRALGRAAHPQRPARRSGQRGRRRRAAAVVEGASIPRRARSATGRAWSATARSAACILTVGEVNEAFDKAGNRGRRATRSRAIRTTPSSTSTSRRRACRPSAAACSATTATSGWPAG